MTSYPIRFPKEIRPIRFERTEVLGMTVDYFFCREESHRYTVSVFCEDREERLQEFTARPLIAEAFYLLLKEEGVLPGTAGALWEDFAADLIGT